MSRLEKIVEVLGEGGSITLYGSRTDEGWTFTSETIDQTDDDSEQATFPHRSDNVRSWDEALTLIDRYQWHVLTPMTVHPDFRMQILDAVRSRVEGTELDVDVGEAWEKICSMPTSTTVVEGQPSSQAPSESSSGPKLNVVYVLSNAVMPGLVKIGFTTQSDANLRIAQLYTTGVPVPFDLEYACKVPNAGEVEKALHIAFGPSRVNAKREFFRIEPEQAIAILKLLHTEDATRQVAGQQDLLDQESRLAAEQAKTKRPKMNFAEMGIPVGSQLQYAHGDVSVTVSGPKKVTYQGDEESLTAVTKHLLGLDYSVQPSPHWLFQGKLLKELYDETYNEADN